MTDYNAPKVHLGLAAILKHLQVDKDGKLPSNMGGKGYITAPAISEEVKKELVKNNLIMLPNETLEKHEAVAADGRSYKIFTTVQGEYTFVSLEDGSSATVRGAGDGLASNNAVSTNIASTMALKNALLRTFLISEDAVEKQSMQDQGGAAADTTNRAVKAVKKPAEKTPSGKGNFNAATEMQSKVQAEFIETGKMAREDVNAIFKEFKDEGKKGLELWTAVYESVKASVGE